MLGRGAVNKAYDPTRPVPEVPKPDPNLYSYKVLFKTKGEAGWGKYMLVGTIEEAKAKEAEFVRQGLLTEIRPVPKIVPKK